MDWEKAHLLYRNFRARTEIFEWYALTIEEFRARYEESIVPFPNKGIPDGFAICTKEGGTIVVRAIVSAGELTAVEHEELTGFLEESYTGFSKILYLIVSTDAAAMSFFASSGYAPGLKRARLIAQVGALNSAVELPAEFSLRSYKAPDDRNNFAQIMNATFADVWNHEEITMDRVAQWDQEEQFDAEGYTFLLHKGEIVGFLAVSIERGTSSRGKVCTLHEIGVLPKYRKMKLGSLLLSHGVAFARGRDADVMYLTVDESNEKALRFYQQAGFGMLYEMCTFLKQLPVKPSHAISAGARTAPPE